MKGTHRAKAHQEIEYDPILFEGGYLHHDQEKQKAQDGANDRANETIQGVLCCAMNQGLHADDGSNCRFTRHSIPLISSVHVEQKAQGDGHGGQKPKINNVILLQQTLLKLT